MSRIEVKSLHQRGVLWRAYATDGHGSPTIEPPVEIPVRWEESDRESVDAQGTVRILNAEVWVDRFIPNESIMRLGTLLDLPTNPDMLMVVIDCPSTPDLKGRSTQYSVLLMRYSNTLPDEVGTAT